MKNSDPLWLNILGGSFGLVLMVLAVAIAVYWLLFPWFVYHKLEKIIKHMERLIDLGKIPREVIIPPTPPPALPPLPGKERYYIAIGDHIGGPYPVEQVRTMLSQGTRLHEAYALKEGATEWKYASELKF